jgi:tripeptidyl-peptidase I
MLKHLLSIFLIGFIAIRSAYGTGSFSYSIKERHNVPERWKPIRRAAPDHEIVLQIGLKQGRFDELEWHLNEGACPNK